MGMQDGMEMGWIRTYFEQLQIEVLSTGHTRVHNEWRNDNVAPLFSVIYFIQEGEGSIQIKGEVFNPKPGQLYILPAGVVHSYSTSSHNPFLKYWCHFNAKVGEMHLFHLIDIPFCLKVNDLEYVADLFAQLDTANHSQELTAPLLAKTMLLEILRYIVSHSSESIKLSSSRQIDKLNDIVKYIETHLSEDLSLEQLAKVANYSPNYFIQFFKSMLNIPPIQYVNKVRIEKAKRLLLTTDHTLSQIAAEIGMETNYFSKLFKQYTNLPPGHFRNMGR